MSTRTTEIISKNPGPKPIVRDKDYYLNSLNIEHDLLKKATDLAERMMVAFMRENRVEVSVNVDDIADKIIDKIGDKLQSYAIQNPNLGWENTPSKKKDDFNLDDGPVIIKTEKIEVKGKVGNITKTEDNISNNLDVLDNLQI